MRSAADRHPIVTLAVGGALLVGATFVAPFLLPDDDPADVVTRQTARVAVLFWGLAVGLLLVGRRNWARSAWLVGALTFLIHVATAFDRVHGWSHSAALRHVEAVSGFGSGLLVSYAFTILWTGDAAWWWADQRSYETRSRWLDWAMHGFIAFVVFNGTVVYETGFIRWAGVMLFVALGVLWARRGLGFCVAGR